MIPWNRNRLSARLNSCFWELNIQLPHQFFDKEIGRSILKICFGSTT